MATVCESGLQRHIYTFQEYYDIIYRHGKANGNAHETRTLSKAAYPNCVTPNHTTFSIAFQQLCEQGSVGCQRRDVVPRGHDDDLDDHLLLLKISKICLEM